MRIITLKYGQQKILADKLRVHPVYLSAVLHGSRRPSPDLALAIQEATGGAVTVMELLFPKERANSLKGEAAGQ